VLKQEDTVGLVIKYIDIILSWKICFDFSFPIENTNSLKSNSQWCCQ